MRYWTVVLAALGLVAGILPLTRAVHTVIGDAQIVCALGLAALLVRFVMAALRPGAVSSLENPGSVPPPPEDVPLPE